MDFKELDVKSIHDAAVEDCNDSVKKMDMYQDYLRDLRSEIYFLVSIMLDNDTNFADVENVLDNISNHIYNITDVFTDVSNTAKTYSKLISSLTEEQTE